MAKYVPDSSSRRWVIVSQGRVARPSGEVAHAEKSPVDPFAKGHESTTPEEVFRVGKGMANEPGWQTRVVTNKYPITDFHEVVVHSPDPKRDISQMSDDEVVPIFQAYRARFNAYRERGSVMIFCNFGQTAGASLEHPHSQIVLLPPQINMDSLAREPVSNIVHENDMFQAYCPDFSQWPYELWIAPQREGVQFGDTTDEEIENLAHIMRVMLSRLRMIHERENIVMPFAYNYYISPQKNWYLRIIPRFVTRAGFELGTGLSVNIVDPFDAACAYQQIDPHTDELVVELQNHARDPLK